jgi:hypothetical protein
MPVKKSAAAKKRTSGAKRGPGRPKGSKNKTTAKNVKEVKKPAGKRGGFHREVNPDTGFVVDTDQDAIALALLEGGESRGEIIDSLYSVLGTETRNGTEKQIPNMVSGVLNKMLANGFTVESSFRVVAPTAASKRAATRAANKKTTAAPAKKTAAKKPAAKKTASGKRRGRPPGSKNKKK